MEWRINQKFINTFMHSLKTTYSLSKLYMIQIEIINDSKPYCSLQWFMIDFTFKQTIRVKVEI